MNEEERILEYIKKEYGYYDNYVRDLLDLYKKEKEKNKELLKTIPIDNYDDRYLKSVYMGGYYDGLRAKIKENWNNAQKVEIKSQVVPKYKIRELPKTEYCNAECLMNGTYVDWEDIKELLEENNE